MNGARPMTRRTKALLSLLGIFTLGALCGALAVGAFVRGEVRRAHRLSDRVGFREYFADELELTRAQRDSLQEELDVFYAQLADLRSAAAGDFHAIIDSLDARLVTYLSPEQVERLRRAETKLRRRMPAPRAASGVGEDLDRASDAPQGARAQREPAATAPREASPAAAAKGREPSVTASVDTTGSARETRGDTVGASSIAPGEEIALGAQERLRTQLSLSDAQFARIQAIVASTRRAIRREVTERAGLPRMQLEAIGRNLRRMDAEILEVLEPEQRVAYEPIRRDIRKQTRSKLLKHMKRQHRSKRSADGAATE